MEQFVPDYYKDFRCAAAACADSCCRAGWLIPLDGETYDYYLSRKIDIAAGTETDPDGDRVFKLNPDGSCVYLKDGLCSLYTVCSRQGELCEKYPRFFEEYDGFREAGISVSCPEAADLILNRADNPYHGLSRKTDDRLLAFLVSARAEAMKMIYGEPDPDIALRRLVGYSAQLQELIDADRLGLLGECGFGSAPRLRLNMPAVRRFILNETEILSERWRELLESEPCRAGTKLERRNYLAYLTYRWFLKAINSEYVLGQCRLIAVLYRLASQLCGDYRLAVRLISREIEHDSENVDMLLDFLE